RLALGEDLDQFRFGTRQRTRGQSDGWPGNAGPSVFPAVRPCGRTTRLTPQARLLGLVLQLLAQQRAELGGTAGSFRRDLVVLGQGVGRLGLVLGADRQLQRAALAILAGVLGLDRIAHLQVLAGVVDAHVGDVAGGHIAFHALTQVDDRTLGVHFLDRAGDLGATRVVGQELAVRILLELLDAQRDALALRIDRQHNRLERVALLEVARDLFPGGVPGDVGQVDQAIDAAVQADEDAEVGDRLDLAVDLVALLVDGREGLPRVGRDLLDAQRDAATLFVHVQHHHFHLVTDLHHLGRIDVLVGPVHLGHVDQALDARLDLDERAVIGDVADLAEHAGVGRVAARDVVPRILAQLLQAQADAVALLVVLEHADVQLLADLDHLGRMAHALPGHVGDVQQAVDAAQVHERAVVGEVLDHALEHGTLDQLLHQRLALLGVLALDDGTAGDHDVVALAVELDELELQLLAFQVHRVAHRAHVDQRTGQERAHVADVDGEAALDLAADAAGDGFVLLEGFLELVPHHRALGLLARQHGLAEAVLEAVQRHLDGVADGDVDLAFVVTELFDRHDAFGLESGVDDDHVGADVDHGAADDGTGLELGQVGLALFEQFCE